MSGTDSTTLPVRPPNSDRFSAKSAARATAWKPDAAAWKTYAAAWKTHATAWKTHAAAWKTNATSWKTYAVAWKTNATSWKTYAGTRKTRGAIATCGVIAGVIVIPAASAQPSSCQRIWQSMDGGPTSRGVAIVRSVATWDPNPSDNVVPWLVAGGQFTSRGGSSLDSLARWDGSAWSGLGLSGGNLIMAISSWDPDGPGHQMPQLVIGGVIAAQGGIAMRGIARFDGTTWLPFDQGFSGSSPGATGITTAFATWDPDGAGPAIAQLVAGGVFVNAGSVTVNNIARWGGTHWEPIGSGFDGSVSALTTWDSDGDGPDFPRLVAGGNFLNAGGVTVNRIAVWDLTTWRSLDGGADATVTELVSWDPDADGPLTPQLVAGGSFVHIGGIPVQRIARWDGNEWASFPSVWTSTVESLATWDHDGNQATGDALAVAGNGSLAQLTWGATTWSSPGGVFTGPGFGFVFALCESQDVFGNPSLVAGGSFTEVDVSLGVRLNVTGIAQVACAPPIVCDDIDFNNNEVFPEDADVIEFFNVLAGADCPTCNDIDFNNNGVFPEDQDVIDFFNVLAGGTCS
jgi:hypothetical protein